MRGSFTALDLPGAVARVRPEAEAWVRRVLDDGRTLFEEAASDPRHLELRGRGPAYAIPVPAAGAGEEVEAAAAPGTLRERRAPRRWLVRHYRRGGAVAPLLGDRYLRVGTPRPFRELAASEAVRARGVETPRVMAATVHPAGPFYRGDLVTEYVEDARDLAEALFREDRPPAERRRVLTATGRLVAELADAGVRHRDLNAKNVLLKGEGEALRPLVLDLDRCRLDPAHQAASPEAMLERLLRSLAGFEEATGRALDAGEREALIRSARGEDAT